MGKSVGRRVYDVYSELPDGVKKHTDKAIRVCAKATKKLRDRKEIERQGKAFTKSLRKRIHI